MFDPTLRNMLLPPPYQVPTSLAQYNQVFDWKAIITALRICKNIRMKRVRRGEGKSFVVFAAQSRQKSQGPE